MRSKFDRYVSPLRRLQFLANLIAIATSVQVTESIRICRDPKDDKFLELAVSGQAVCIVSGDKDLLVLHPFQGIASGKGLLRILLVTGSIFPRYIFGEAFLNSLPDEKQRQDSFTVLELMKQVTQAEPKMWGSSIIGLGDLQFETNFVNPSISLAHR